MQKRSTRFYRKNEAEVMESLGLKPTKNSGAGWIEKEDGENDYVLSQLKSTDAESIRVFQKDIHTLEYHADVSHKIPVFFVQFLNKGEVYAMARPNDIPLLAKYLECGKVDIISPVIVLDEQVKEPTKVIKSGNRDKFWKNKEKERQKWGKK